MVVIKDDTNIVNLTGELEDNLEFSHEIFGEKFFNTKIKINRLSDVYDILPMTVSERLIEELDFKNNKFVTVSGQLRSYNKNVGEKNKLILTVFVREIKPKEEENPKNVESGDLKLDCESRRLFILGKEVNVTAKEFDLLELLVMNPNKVYSRENLLNLVWGYEYPGDVRTVDVHVRRLREKIEANPSEPKYVHTKWGVGYYYQS